MNCQYSKQPSQSALRLKAQALDLNRGPIAYRSIALKPTELQGHINKCKFCKAKLTKTQKLFLINQFIGLTLSERSTASTSSLPHCYLFLSNEFRYLDFIGLSGLGRTRTYVATARGFGLIRPHSSRN